MQVENFPTNSGFTPLADADTKYPSPDDGKAKIANAGPEADFMRTTKEAPCDEGQPMDSDSKSRWSQGATTAPKKEF